MSSRRASGVTIIELILFLTIMGVAAAGVIAILNMSGGNSVTPLARKQALMVAEALMEEVLQARYTLCNPADNTADSATQANQCTTQVNIGWRAANAARPFGNVAEYANVAGVPQTTFAVNGVDTDINGQALGGAGNAAFAGISSTVTLNYLTNALGTAAAPITSTANNPIALQITIITTYPGGAVRLDGYRTRYAPRQLP